MREDSQRFVKAVEGGDGKEARRAVQAVKGRGQQLLRVVREDVAGNSRAYSQDQLPAMEASAKTLADKCTTEPEMTELSHDYLLSLCLSLSLSSVMVQ